MFGLFSRILKKNKKPEKLAHDPVRYEEEKKIAEGEDPGKRLTLAGDRKTHQEILYYLAEKDPDPKVRKAVAENPAMPVHVSPILAVDQNEDVRMALAARLVALLPELSEDTHSHLYAYAVQGLATLALDEVLKIRRALSSALKDHADTPPKVAGQLARDIEREVAEPILRFCAALADDDLLDILKGHPESWAVQAVAEREDVSEPVSEAVIDTGDVEAGALLIKNDGAQISQSLLEHIVEKAKELPEWHAPIATRKTLPPKMAQELARFVDASVHDLLVKRADFDEETAAEVEEAFRRRMEFASEEGDSSETPIKRAARLDKDGRLSEETIADALGMQDREFVIAALAHLTQTSVPEISRIVEMKAPKAIVAVTWKAGLSMRLALQLQKELAHISHQELLYPKDGSDYPLTKDELLWQLDFLGLEAA